MSEHLYLFVTLPSGKKAKAPLTKEILDMLSAEHLTNQISHGWNKSKLSLNLTDLYTDDNVALESVKRFAKIMRIYSQLRSAGFNTIENYLQKKDEMEKISERVKEIKRSIHSLITYYDYKEDELSDQFAELSDLGKEFVEIPHIDFHPGFAIDGNTVLLLDYMGEHSVLSDYLESHPAWVDWKSFCKIMDKYSESVYSHIYNTYLLSCRVDRGSATLHHLNLIAARDLTVRIYESGEVSRKDLIKILNVPSKLQTKFAKCDKWEEYEKFLKVMVDKEKETERMKIVGFDLKWLNTEIEGILSEMNRRIERRSRGGCERFRYIHSDDLKKLYDDRVNQYNRLLYGE